MVEAQPKWYRARILFKQDGKLLIMLPGPATSWAMFERMYFPDFRKKISLLGGAVLQLRSSVVNLLENKCSQF